MITCAECNGNCCRYISVGIDKPEDDEDFDEIKWFLLHEKVSVYIDDEDDWIVEFMTPCKHLGEDNRCQIYENRLQICRDHSMEECDVNGEGEPHKVLFTTPEEFDKYCKEVLLKEKKEEKQE